MNHFATEYMKKSHTNETNGDIETMKIKVGRKKYDTMRMVKQFQWNLPRG